MNDEIEGHAAVWAILAHHFGDAARLRLCRVRDSMQDRLSTVRSSMAPPVLPTNLKAIREQRVFEIEWPNSPQTRIGFRDLRLLCPCAGCVDEFTGERIVNPAMVPDDVAPTAMKYSGNYALKITWSDNHDTGIYSWEYLAKLPVEQLEQLKQ